MPNTTMPPLKQKKQMCTCPNKNLHPFYLQPVPIGEDEMLGMAAQPT